MLQLGLMLALSMAPQSCDAFNPVADAVDGVHSALRQARHAVFGKSEEEKPVPENTVANCRDGAFTCIGYDKEYCQEQKRLCKKSNKKKSDAGSTTCHPECHWQCEDRKCEQACAPKCSPPACQTRCKGLNTQSCSIKCGQPTCAVICPKQICHSQGCPKCTTQCSPPSCHLQCGQDLQDCKNVCAEPLCQWDCKDPKACPKPVCQMKCQAPENCLGKMASGAAQLPALEPGETQVTNFEATTKSLLLQVTKMQVNVSTLGQDGSLTTRQVELPLSPGSGDTWTTKLSTFETGHVVRSAASCEEGDFKCNGDRAWCAEQQRNACRVTSQLPPRVFMQHLGTGSQASLQP